MKETKMRRLITVSVVLVLFATACGDSGDGSSALDGGSSSNWCDLAVEIEDFSDSFNDPSADAFRAFSDLLDGVSDSAPSEIRSDVELLSEVMDDIVKAIDDNDGNLILAFDSLTAELTDPELDEAGDRISAYNERECGIVDDDSVSSDSSDSDDASDTSDSEADSSDSSDSDENPFGEEGLVAGLAESLGITEEQARCLVTEVDFLEDEEPDLTVLMDVFTDCGIDPFSLEG